ncbi:MAG: hypothetical protein ABIY50_04955 [Ignavibacteria bacterium]
MKKLFIVSLLISTLIISCSDKKPETVVKKDSTEKMTVKKDTAVTVKKEMTTKTGKQFVIIETKPSFSVSDYMITGVGFENSKDTIKYSLKNPMSTAMLADLDKNGFDEVYVITKSTGSGSFEDIIAIASFNDKTFGEIIVEEMPADVGKNEKFGGYMGHDSIYINDNKLIREFPVYKNSDQNSASTGGRRKIIYSLKPNQASYELAITGVENVK